MNRRLLMTTMALLLLPAAMLAAAPADRELAGKIDAEIQAAHRQAKLTAAPRATDEELLRRIYLDLLGRIPTVAECEAYLADEASDKHHALIDRLLAHPEMPAYWKRVVNHWLNGHQPRDGRPPYFEEFLAYLERSLAANKPWDQLARELLLPQAGNADQRGASYFLASRMQNGDKLEQLDNLTTAVASGLFGVQLQCAKCHDHPFVDDWKQDHYYGLAAFFQRVERQNGDGLFVLREKVDGETKFVTVRKVERTAAAMFLDGAVLDEPRPPGKGGDSKQEAKEADGRRAKLIAHAIDKGSPFFRRSLVNRVWKELLGRGFVEPVDQMHAGNPPTHPAVLELLASDLADHDYELRHLLSGIMHSETYLRSSRWEQGERPDDAQFAVAILRPLSGQQMAWSLLIATGGHETLPAKYAKEMKSTSPAAALPPELRSRWEKDAESEQMVEKFLATGGEYEPNASQALFLTFGPQLQKLLAPSGKQLVAELAKLDVEGAADRLWLQVLSRRPIDDEKSAASEYLRSSPAKHDAAHRDLVWALLSSAEFRFNH
ncbi:MAG: DUF1549 domain-containing protein [Pirellulaceae bacterium]|nr:DUF1549 domain-containing protein [Pirellulaceae bacterium]